MSIPAEFFDTQMEVHDMTIPVIRADRPACQGPCNQGRQQCPCPDACGLAVREKPASCSDISTLGEKVMLCVCCVAVLVIVAPALWHAVSSLVEKIGGVQ